MAIPEWYTSLAWVTQMAHLFSGWAAVLTVDLWAKRWWMPLLLLQVWALLKEFLWDILIEQDTWPSSLLDWSMYSLGGLVATCVMEARRCSAEKQALWSGIGRLLQKWGE